MHDTGLAAWFGGSLMGVVGLNGAVAEADQPTERLHISAVGWKRWAPVNLAAIGSHLVGAAGIALTERRRMAAQKGVGAVSATKTALTVVALGATAYSRVLGKKMEQADHVPVEDIQDERPGRPDRWRGR